MIRKVSLVILLALSACGQKSVSPDKPESYALGLAVTPAVEGQVQRVILPPAAIAASRREDLADVRIFDAQGRALALARDPGFGLTARRQSNAVPVSPIAMPDPIAPSTISVRVARNEQDVTVDAVNQEADAEMHPRTGLLFDTRKLADPAVELRLDARLPTRRVVDVTVEQSTDLKTWTSLTRRHLFSFGSAANAGQSLVIPLAGATLKDSYLRVSWQLASDFVVSGGTVETVRQAPAPRASLAGQGARLDNPHTITFSVPKPFTTATLRLTGNGKDGVVPLSLQARINPEKPWFETSSGVLRDGQSLDLDLAGQGLAQYRLVADPRSPGLASLPKLELLGEPVAVLAAFNASPPYRLAVGLAEAPDRYFASEELLGAQANASLPLASVESPPNPAVRLGPDSPAGPLSPRKIGLWAALLAATALLSFAAWRLMKAEEVSPPAG